MILLTIHRQEICAARALDALPQARSATMAPDSIRMWIRIGAAAG
jgi:hypothetical protein